MRRIHPYDPTHAARSRGDLKFGYLPRLTMLCALFGASVANGASEDHLWDEAAALSSADRAQVERLLALAGHRLGNPVFVQIAGKLHGDSATAMAEQSLAERTRGGAAESNPVLLLITIRDRAAAIATGKGNAGIVPEMDAARITRNLLASPKSHGLKVALERAIDAIVESAEATAERRRPLPPDDGESPSTDLPAAAPARRDQGPSRSGGPTPANVASDAEIDADADAGKSPLVRQAPGNSGPSTRSRLPFAVAAGALLLLALALRRRKQLSAERDRPVPPPGSPGSPGPGRGRSEPPRDRPGGGTRPPRP